LAHWDHDQARRQRSSALAAVAIPAAIGNVLGELPSSTNDVTKSARMNRAGSTGFVPSDRGC